MFKKVAILRGVNVGGKRKVLMADLKAMFLHLNFLHVQTYIQSGNVIFDTETDFGNKELGQTIARAIHKTFGFDVPVVVRTPNELERALNQNPFYTMQADINSLHLTFLHQSPASDKLDEIKTYPTGADKFEIMGSNAFIQCAGKYHQSKLTNDFFEKKLKVSATTRNWKTVLMLVELSK